MRPRGTHTQSARAWAVADAPPLAPHQAAKSLQSLETLLACSRLKLLGRGFRKWREAHRAATRREPIRINLAEIDRTMMEEEIKALHAQLQLAKKETWKWKKKMMASWTPPA